MLFGDAHGGCAITAEHDFLTGEQDHLPHCSKPMERLQKWLIVELLIMSSLCHDDFSFNPSSLRNLLPILIRSILNAAVRMSWRPGVLPEISARATVCTLLGACSADRNVASSKERRAP
jgi:hypothetical protein